MTTAISLLSSAASATASPATLTFSLRCTSTALPPPSSVYMVTAVTRRPMLVRCEVAVKSESSTSIGGDASAEEDAESKRKLEVEGSRVRVRVPVKLYHVPKIPEMELEPGTEGVIKQYVGFWKGKRITANFPYKVEFQIDVEGRGKVKFFAHLKEDEFEFV